jgi:hypothetical protein
VAYTPEDEEARRGLAVLRDRREKLWPPSHSLNAEAIGAGT